MAEGWEIATAPANGSGTDGAQPTTAGLIAVSAPTNNSADDIGVKFVDPGSIPGLKGATGQTGAQGVQGNAGSQGVAGSKGATGAQGIQGVKGDKGDKGDQGVQGAKGDSADVPAIDPRLNVKIRHYDSKYWTLNSFASFGMQSGTSRYIVGEELVLKLGKSYESKQQEKLEARLALMERILKGVR